MNTLFCFTDRSKAVVPVLVLLFVTLWFILRGDLLYVFPCVILFLCFSVLIVLRLPRLGKRELIFVLLYVCSICACLDLPIFSSSWGLGRAAVYDCGTLWTCLPFFYMSERKLFVTRICPPRALPFLFAASEFRMRFRAKCGFHTDRFKAVLCVCVCGIICSVCGILVCFHLSFFCCPGRICAIIVTFSGYLYLYFRTLSICKILLQLIVATPISHTATVIFFTNSSMLNSSSSKEQTAF